MFITKTDDKKYSATLIPNCITMATMMKVFELFLKRVCWVSLWSSTCVPGRRFLVIYLAHAFSVICVCLCSSAVLFSISAHFSWPLSFSALCVAPWTGQLFSCLPPAPDVRSLLPSLPLCQGTGTPTRTRATSCSSAGLSPVSQTSSGLHKPCMGLGTAGTGG